MSQLVVVGAGALGRLLAARAVLAKLDVALLGRTPAQSVTYAFEQEGMTRRVTVPASADAAEFVVVCVKVADTAGAADTAARLAGADGTVVALQNGLGRAAEVARVAGRPDRSVGAVTSEGATRIEAGVRHAGRGPTRLAPLTEAGRPRAEAAAALLRRAGYDATVAPDLRQLEWEKVLVNAAINALTGLLDRENGALLFSPSAKALASAAAREVAATARALGVPGAWDAEGCDARWVAVAAATARNLSSTVQDLRSARKTEVHAMNGAVARAAHEAGVPAPTNDLLARLIAAREELSAV
jgi:2-dehydropantoate 2-reductase